MSSSSKKVPETQRLDLQVAPEIKERIQMAADIQGRSLTDFIVSVVQDAAERIITNHHRVQLTLEESRLVAELLLYPPESNARLQKAAANYQAMVVPGGHNE